MQVLEPSLYTLATQVGAMMTVMPKIATGRQESRSGGGRTGGSTGCGATGGAGSGIAEGGGGTADEGGKRATDGAAEAALTRVPANHFEEGHLERSLHDLAGKKGSCKARGYAPPGSIAAGDGKFRVVGSSPGAFGPHVFQISGGCMRQLPLLRVPFSRETATPSSDSKMSSSRLQKPFPWTTSFLGTGIPTPWLTYCARGMRLRPSNLGSENRGTFSPL